MHPAAFEGGGGHARAAGVLLNSSLWELSTPMVVVTDGKRKKLKIGG